MIWYEMIYDMMIWCLWYATYDMWHACHLSKDRTRSIHRGMTCISGAGFIFLFKYYFQTNMTDGGSWWINLNSNFLCQFFSQKFHLAEENNVKLLLLQLFWQKLCVVWWIHQILTSSWHLLMCFLLFGQRGQTFHFNSYLHLWKVTCSSSVKDTILKYAWPFSINIDAYARLHILCPSWPGLELWLDLVLG